MMNQDERTALLSRTPLFKSLPRSELEHLAQTLPSHEFSLGAVLMREGEADRQFLILLEGEVEVVKALGTPDERPLGIRSSGTVFGEMGLFHPQGSHTASVRARTPALTLEMTYQDFDRLLQGHPDMVYDLARTLSRQLDETENATILDLREKNRELTRAYQELQAAQEQLIIKERLEKELAIARQIQESILPDSLPHLEGFDIAALTVPAREVGGDYYDFIPIDHHRFGLVIGDACDKGIPAALYINITNSLMHIEAPRNPSPEATLQMVNRHLLGMSRSGMFVTLLVRHPGYLRSFRLLPGRPSEPAGAGWTPEAGPDPIAHRHAARTPGGGDTGCAECHHPAGRDDGRLQRRIERGPECPWASVWS